MVSEMKQQVIFGYLMVALAAVLVLMNGAAADTYTVGDNLKWTVPPGGSIAYQTWAKTKDFQLGDSVVFEWSNIHTVAQVNQSDYDDCNSRNAIGGIHTTSPYNFIINSTNPYYFICSIDNHCGLGQKVKIQVGAAASSSLKAGAFFTILLSLAICFSTLL